MATQSEGRALVSVGQDHEVSQRIVSLKPKRRRLGTNESDIISAANAHMWSLDDRAGTYKPTLEEIRAACLEIQAGWSDEERARRRTPALDHIEWRCPGTATKNRVTPRGVESR